MARQSWVAVWVVMLGLCAGLSGCGGGTDTPDDMGSGDGASVVFAVTTSRGRAAFARLQNASGGLAYRSDETNFTLGLAELNARLKRRALVILFTEFIDTTTAEIFLIEGVDRVLTAFSPALSEHAERDLAGLGRHSQGDDGLGVDPERDAGAGWRAAPAAPSLAGRAWSARWAAHWPVIIWFRQPSRAFPLTALN